MLHEFRWQFRKRCFANLDEQLVVVGERLERLVGYCAELAAADLEVAQLARGDAVQLRGERGVGPLQQQPPQRRQR